MSVINTNYLALVSQNNLTKSQNALGTAIERLSSGLRINSAKDDAAGQAIANRFTANINGLTQAGRNANDGISIAQTTEGSLNEINENLQRIRVLTNQAVNGTNSDTDLKSIQDEIDQRLGEINRVSEQTQFNGVKVLAGDQGLKIQVGANDNETITVNLKQIDASTLGLSGFNVNGKGSIANRAANETDLKAAGNVSGPVTAGDPYTLKVDNAKASVNDVFAAAGSKNAATIVVSGNVGSPPAAVTTGTFANALGFSSGKVDLSTGLDSNGDGTFAVTVTQFTKTSLETAITGTTDGPVAASYTNKAGATQEILVDSTGNITDQDGKQLYLSADGDLSLNSGSNTVATAGGLASFIGSVAAGTNATLAVEGGATYTSTGTLNEINVAATISADQLQTVASDNQDLIFTTNLDDGTGTTFLRVTAGEVQSTNAGNDLVYLSGNAASPFTLDETTDTELFVRDNGKVTDASANQYFVDADGNLTTEEATISARTENPLAALDKALADVDSLRSELGAVQNRFQSTIANLANTVNNLSAARSRIQDADYAVEVSNMTRAQILQQAGTSVLAQANQVPQGVLSLLR